MSENKPLRCREPGKHALYNPETGLHESPSPDAQFTADHALVKEHPWAFATDEEIAAERAGAKLVTSVPQPPAPVEQATAGPGEKRNVRRRATGG